MLCEILLKNDKVLKVYSYKIFFMVFVFAAWVSVFSEHVLERNCYIEALDMKVHITPFQLKKAFKNV